ncbi:hypothetical protein [Streptomyces nondiastaticus]|uniref:Resolvase/invertase-type recombinase catalytic domain-containing protein n=1 Tax=Streptomyces nondiastaticus TaxID=3154512 RepID=A0ABW6U2X6_9ACTN
MVLLLPPRHLLPRCLLPWMNVLFHSTIAAAARPGIVHDDQRGLRRGKEGRALRSIPEEELRP